MRTDNMRIWEALGKTDPAHTKQFTRAGGFKGTAIKPMWANKQMTEFFGPCGIGWGMTEPIFQVVPAGDEIMVYCTVSLWYADGRQLHNTAYGVGGDKVLSQVLLKDDRGQKIFDTEAGRYKTYPQSDDEAFKKAYTDALSNAMKFIGVAADVHMGLFDDNKYVQQVRGEFEADKQAEIEAEVERQKKNPTKIENGVGTAPEGAKNLQGGVQPINEKPLLTRQLEASLTPEERAAAERTALAEKQGNFSIDGDVLTCKIVGIQRKQMSAKTKTPGKEFLSVTFNGRLPNGASYASVFDTELYEALDKCLDKECSLKIAVKGVYVNVEDVLWIQGLGPLTEPEHAVTPIEFKASDADIPF